MASKFFETSKTKSTKHQNKKSLSGRLSALSPKFKLAAVTTLCLALATGSAYVGYQLTQGQSSLVTVHSEPSSNRAHQHRDVKSNSLQTARHFSESTSSKATPSQKNTKKVDHKKSKKVASNKKVKSNKHSNFKQTSHKKVKSKVTKNATKKVAKKSTKHKSKKTHNANKKTHKSKSGKVTLTSAQRS